MRHINISDLSRDEASYMIKEVTEKDEPVYALRYGKLIVVLISNECCEILINEGIDTIEH